MTKYLGFDQGNSDDNRAFETLRRVEEAEAILSTNLDVDPSIIKKLLRSDVELIRIEVLDYISEKSSIPDVKEDLLKLAGVEVDVQCVSRIVFISYKFDEDAILSAVSYRPTIDESEYIGLWVKAGQFAQSSDRLSLRVLQIYAELGDWELATLSKNLIRLISSE